MKKETKKRKHKNGIWFNDTANIENYAALNAQRVEKIIENVLFYGITIPFQLFQTAGVFVIAYFNNAFPQLSFFLVAFFFTRTFLGETFHMHSTVGCTTLTWLLFFIVTTFIPSVYTSVFLSLLLGSLLDIREFTEVNKKNKRMHQKKKLVYLRFIKDDESYELNCSLNSNLFAPLL